MAAGTIWAFEPEDAFLGLQGLVAQSVSLDYVMPSGLLQNLLHLSVLLILGWMAWTMMSGGNWIAHAERVVMLLLFWWAVNLPRVSVEASTAYVKRQGIQEPTVGSVQVSAPFYWIAKGVGSFMGALTEVLDKSNQEAARRTPVVARQFLAMSVAARVTDLDLRQDLQAFAAKCFPADVLSRLQKKYDSSIAQALRAGVMANDDIRKEIAGLTVGLSDGKQWPCDQASMTLNERMGAWCEREYSGIKWLGRLGDKVLPGQYMCRKALEKVANDESAEALEPGTLRERFYDTLGRWTGGVVTPVVGAWRGLLFTVTEHQWFGSVIGWVTKIAYSLWIVVPVMCLIRGNIGPLMSYAMFLVWVRSWPLFYVLVRRMDAVTDTRIGRELEGYVGSGAGAVDPLLGTLLSMGNLADTVEQAANTALIVQAALINIGIPVLSYMMIFKVMGRAIGAPGVSLGSVARGLVGAKAVS